MTSLFAPDLLDDVLDLDASAVALRDERPDVKRRTQTSAEALLTPTAPDDLSDAERFAAAARVATLNESRALGDHYEKRLAAVPEGARFLAAVRDDTRAVVDERQHAILTPVDQLAPAEARPADVRGPAAGDRHPVAGHQLRELPGPRRLGLGTAGDDATSGRDFSVVILEWRAWTAVVDVTQAIEVTLGEPVRPGPAA